MSPDSSWLDSGRSLSDEAICFVKAAMGICGFPPLVSCGLSAFRQGSVKCLVVPS